MSADKAGLSDIRVGQTFLIKGKICQVSERTHNKLGRGGALLNLKLRELTTGQIVSLTLKGNQTLPEVELTTKKALFLYRSKEKLHLLDKMSLEEIAVPLQALGGKIKFLKPNQELTVLFYETQPLKIELPIKVDLQVVEAPQAIRGNTAKAKVTKEVVLETGARLQAPLFIKQSDMIRINTQTGEYVERVKE